MLAPQDVVITAPFIDMSFKPPTFALEMAAASSAMATTAVIFNPCDVVKTKIQTQSQLSNSVSEVPRLYSNVRHCFRTLLCEQGLLRGLWLPGLTAATARDIINGGIRMGLYPTFVNGISDGAKQVGAPLPSFGVKLLAGWCTGIVGATAGNPTDLIKVRLQAESGKLVNGVYATGLYAGRAPSYRSATHAFIHIVTNEGLRGLFRGCSANIARAALVTSGQMASYDETKIFLQHLSQTWSCFSFIGCESVKVPIASAVSGLVAATMAAPADLVRSRVMDDCRAGTGRRLYTGALDCAAKTVRCNGLLGLWRGWVPAYLRIGPQFIVAFPLMELMRTKVFGLQPFGS